MSRQDPRLGLRERRRLRVAVAAEGLPCALCGGDIDYSGPWDLDEIVARAYGGSPLDRDNVQPAHQYCNRSAGSKIKQVLNAPLPYDAADW